jgi:prepilin-type N-terminal cleavage/methylation domain-containing protein
MKAGRSPGIAAESHSSGFTLIELLVVNAIIAILAVVVVLALNPAPLLSYLLVYED